MYPFASPMMVGQAILAAGSTWDPAFKGAGITLSTDLLTISGPSPGADSITRSTPAKTSGKLYAECKILGGLAAALGAVNGSAVTSEGMGGNANSVAYVPGNGRVLVNGAVQATLAASAVNDLIGLAIDFALRKIWFLKNGAPLSGDPAGGTGGYSIPSGTDIFAAANVSSSSTSLRANFGASAFAYTPPSGFSPWG